MLKFTILIAGVMAVCTARDVSAEPRAANSCRRVVPFAGDTVGPGRWVILEGTGIAGRVPSFMRNGDCAFVPVRGRPARLYRLRKSELVPVGYPTRIRDR